MRTIADGLTVFVPGIPKPQGSMRHIRMGKATVTVHADHDNLIVWRHAVAHEVNQVWGDTPVLDEPVALTLYFYLPRPKSAPKKRLHPDRLPDLDKLVRAVLDSLTGIVLADDARVVSLGAIKNYAVDRPSGCHINLWPMRAVDES